MHIKFIKKFIIVVLWLLFLGLIINLLYDFFRGDNVNNLYDKLYFRAKYYSREIIETTINYNDTSKNNIISKNNISIKLSNISYEKENGLLNANFEIYTNDNSYLEKLRFMLCAHDDKSMFYNKSVGDMLFVGNTDYLLYNKDLYSKLSNKKYDIIKLDVDSQFRINNTENTNCKSVELKFNLGKNEIIQDKFYIEFLDLIYRQLNQVSNKIFDPLGEFKFIIEF